MTELIVGFDARIRTALVAIALAATMVLVGATSSAFGSSFTYCNGCTINSGYAYESNTWAYITTDYVHRLSGPGSGVTIGAVAQYADDGSWGNYVYSSTTEAIHYYNGARPAWGTATNFGAGNYGFNAHVDY